MKVLVIVLVIVTAASEVSEAQRFGHFGHFFRGVGHMAQHGAHRVQHFFQPATHMFHHHVMKPVEQFMPHFSMPRFRMPRFFGGGRETNEIGNTRGKGTKEPQATGEDKVYPDDCGRDEKDKGLLCFPDGLLCANSKKLYTG